MRMLVKVVSFFDEMATDVGSTVVVDERGSLVELVDSKKLINHY